MYKNYLEKKGCILADDMGLGKTVQISVLISSLQRTQGLKDTVVIAPHSLLEYWESEYKVWCGSLTCPIIQIRKQNEEFIIDRLRITERMPRLIIITSNAFISLYKKLEELLTVDILIIDEGHKAKNVDTTLRKTISEFKVRRQKIALTGTPIQNNS
jgi:SNF2 family DNA or RNA helicase